MTPEEAREIDRLEFEADCRAARERVHAAIAQRRSTERTRTLSWLGRVSPAETFVPALSVRPKPTTVKVKPVDPKPRGPKLHSVGDLTMTRKEWAAHLGISINVLDQRLHRTGSMAEAVAIGGARPTGRPGVGKNLPALEETGGWSHAQDIPQIEIFPDDRT